LSHERSGESRGERGLGKPLRLTSWRHSAFHYDVSNDFYALWLDSRLVYSCGYFKSPQDDLEAAQAQKLKYICRKLRLRRGDGLLDLGCGWGGLMQYAAAEYGVEAFGITLSAPQAELARERFRQAGVSAQCRVGSERPPRSRFVTAVRQDCQRWHV
jgi:cyclopropane fatty-acyl-phospholipid synthase-like methyltransferase